jgi:hypothetical protein
MRLTESFSIEGLDELDTQLKLYQMGIETFSPYASTGKVDMIIRSEDGDGEVVYYADVKVCSGKREDDEIIWELEVSFFMKNESFVILTVRLPSKEDELEKHYFIMKSTEFLSIVKKHRFKVQNDIWRITVPYSDLEVINKQSKAKIRPLVKNLRKYFDNWESILEWINSHREPVK